MTGGVPSEELIAATLAAVQASWYSAAKISAAVDGWAPTTVRHALRALTLSGTIERRLVPIAGDQFAAEYRRAP